jgi:hypothetical protein
VAASPTSSTTVIPAAWREVGDSRVLEHATDLRDVAWIDGNWVVVGEDDAGHAGAWWSTDGASWQPASVEGHGGANGFTVMTAVVPFGTKLVAVGWTDPSSGHTSGTNLAQSTPLGPPLADVAPPGRSSIQRADTCEAHVTNANADVWTTTDGRRWARIPESPQLDGDPMNAVVVHRNDLVAAGGADGIGRSASWTSTDGATWKRNPNSKLLRHGWIRALAASNESVLAIAAKGCTTTAPPSPIWRSLDGLTWSPDQAFASVAPSLEPNGVAMGQGRALVVGGVPSEPQPVGASWVATGSGGWTAHQVAGAAPFTAVVSVPDGFLAIADDGVWGSSDGASWHRLAAPTNPFHALGVGPSGALAISDGIWLGPASAGPT